MTIPSPLTKFVCWVARGFGIGNLPVMPGTFGTLLGFGIFFGLLFVGWPWRIALMIFGIFLAVWVTDIAEKARQKHDPPEVVFDEIIALPIACVFVFDVWGKPAAPWLLVAAFVLFRVFDVMKPFGVRQLQRLPGGWGIVMDDVLAAAFAAIDVGILRWILGRLGWGI